MLDYPRMFRAFLILLSLISAVAAASTPEACAVLPGAQVAPTSIGMKPAPVAALIQAAKDSGSTGFAVLKEGKFIAGFGEDKPIPIYSITKPVTGMAAGRLFTEGKWNDLDAAIGSLLPRFAGDPKGAITLRQLMSHTSGIRDARDASNRVLKEWNEAKDWVEASLQQPIEDPAGTVFRYNNQGPALVAAAVEHATGERLDRFVKRTIFEPLCIGGNTKWFTNRAGNQAAGYTGLSISALDLAKLGQLVLNRGLWGSTRVLSEEWIRNSALASSQDVAKGVGLLWFLDWEPKFPLPVVTYHTGDGGQHLLIFPNHGIVVARLRNSGNASDKQAMMNLGQLAANHLIKEQR